MRYAQIEPFEVSNGEGVGISLFTQGCSFKCKGCFNQETWNYTGGHEWTVNEQEKFLNLLSRPYIKRCSILGGEPLERYNLMELLYLFRAIKKTYPEKKIWLYSGFTYEQIMHPVVTDDFNYERDLMIELRQRVVSLCDVLVDGRFNESKKDLSLKFRGSSNQRIIDVQRSLQENKVVLWETE